jgi:hypothetical protein
MDQAMTAFRTANSAARVAHDITLSDVSAADMAVGPFSLPHAPLSMPRQQLEPVRARSRGVFSAILSSFRLLAVGTARSGS